MFVALLSSFYVNLFTAATKSQVIVPSLLQDLISRILYVKIEVRPVLNKSVKVIPKTQEEEQIISSILSEIFTDINFQISYEGIVDTTQNNLNPIKQTENTSLSTEEDVKHDYVVVYKGILYNRKDIQYLFENLFLSENFKYAENFRRSCKKQKVLITIPLCSISRECNLSFTKQFMKKLDGYDLILKPYFIELPTKLLKEITGYKRKFWVRDHW